jgi:4-hydroxyphenylpyruvate dioxygenase
MSTVAARTNAHQRSIATVSLSGSLPEKLEAAAAVGFDAVEIFENDLLTYDGSPEDVRRIATGLGLSIAMFQPFRDFEAMPAPQRERNLDRARRKFDVMHALGTDLILVCSNTQAAASADDARAADDLASMAELAAAQGLRIGYEALAWGRHVNRWRHAWSIVQRAAHPALGLIVDSFHTLALRDDPSGIAEVPADKLFFVQLADAPWLDMDVLSWSRHFRNFPGQGQLPVTEFLRAALASGYRGPLSLEIFNDDFRAAPARLTAQDGLRSLILVESEARGASGSTGAGAAPGAGVLPLPSTYAGFEFLEFAVDDETGGALSARFAALGFRHVGHHRSKAVDLYRQGEINLVVNREPHSAASELFELHGPSVCAMAWRVNDPGRAMARASELRVPEWRERVGEGERRIAALRAPDGMLIYLVPTERGHSTIYENDFVLSHDARPDEPAAAHGSLTLIDHVSQALPYGRLDSFVLFYRAVFGFTAAPLLELPDPYGIVRSRAMVSPCRTIRLPLNISESRNTATGRFVSAYSGAGVHHIAFATDDIMTAADRIVDAGTQLLRMPSNYYDDLAARHGLDDAFIGGLQRRNLLYDRDPAGDFMHCYTDSFDDRFFFEIVQRRGYRQFGETNAAVRMAVQAQQPTTAIGTGTPAQRPGMRVPAGSR